MYYVYINDSIGDTFRSPVAAELYAAQWREDADVHVEYDEGAC